MVKRVCLLVLSGLLTTLPATASNWSRVSTSPQGVEGFINLDSINPVGGTVGAWTKISFPPGMAESSAIVGHYIFDCQGKTAALIQLENYLWNGSILSENMAQGVFEPVPPNSMREAFYLAACGSKP